MRLVTGTSPARRALSALGVALALAAVLLSAAPRSCASAAPASEGFVVTPDSVRLYYRIIGNGPDTLVVLHGGPGFHSRYLSPDMGSLGPGRTAIYYDQRGAGRSTVVTDSTRLTLAAHVEDLEALRRHFRLDRMTIVGHSWGAALGAAYARAHPDRIGHLVLVDSMPPRRTPYLEQFGANLSAWMDSTTAERVDSLRGAQKTAPDRVAACRAYWQLAIRGYLANPADTTLLTRMRGDLCDAPVEALRNAGRVYASAMKPLGDWDWRGDFHAVTAPVLIIHGARDPIPLDSAREWQAAFPNARLVTIEGSGHLPWIEQPEAFQRALDGFLHF